MFVTGAAFHRPYVPEGCEVWVRTGYPSRGLACRLGSSIIKSASSLEGCEVACRDGCRRGWRASIGSAELRALSQVRRPPSGGNGGFSLRRRSAMLRALAEFAPLRSVTTMCAQNVPAPSHVREGGNRRHTAHSSGSCRPHVDRVVLVVLARGS